MDLFSFLKKTPFAFCSEVKLIGVYNVPNMPEVKLVELLVHTSPENFDIGSISQEIKGLDRMSWQTAYDEKYIDIEGNEIKANKTAPFRLLFFFHYLDVSKPLITQYGYTKLSITGPMPQKLADWVTYSPPD